MAYAYFDDYRAIITRADNWRASFGAVFGDKPEFEVCMRWVGRVRDPIAHSRHIDDQEYGAFVTAANILQSGIMRSRESGGG